MRLGLDGGCRFLGTLGSNNLRAASDSLSFSAILSAFLFMDLMFFLLNALVILSFKVPIWDFRLLISASRLTNFLASLDPYFAYV